MSQKTNFYVFLGVVKYLLESFDEDLKEGLELEKRIEIARVLPQLGNALIKVLGEIPEDNIDSNMPDLTLLKQQKQAIIEHIRTQLN